MAQHKMSILKNIAFGEQENPDGYFSYLFEAMNLHHQSYRCYLEHEWTATVLFFL